TRYDFRFAGRHALKNIPEMVSLYHVVPPGGAHAREANHQLRVTVVDGLAIVDADGESVTIRSRRAQALVGYLSLADDFGDFQDRIAALLWPDLPIDDARESLNNCLRPVGKIFAGDLRNKGLRRGNIVSLDKARVSVDINRILTDLSS